MAYSRSLGSPGCTQRDSMPDIRQKKLEAPIMPAGFQDLSSSVSHHVISLTYL